LLHPLKGARSFQLHRKNAPNGEGISGKYAKAQMPGKKRDRDSDPRLTRHVLRRLLLYDALKAFLLAESGTLH
jgi:hypothetical protein